MPEDTEDYENVGFDENEMDDIAEHVDYLKERKKTQLQSQMNQYEDDIDLPESFEVAAHKYDLNPDIPNEQQPRFREDRAFYGVHVVNSNTQRKDNFRHLNAMDLVDDYDRIPSMRHRATQIRKRITGEFQMCRSNPETGGFDRKLQRSVLKREDVDLKQAQTLSNLNQKKSGILGFLRRNK